jgi:plastocyanin
MTRHLLALVVLASPALAFSLIACGEDKSTSPAPTEVLDSPALLGHTSGSQNYIHTFTNAGSHPYHCKYHTTSSHREAGTVIVNDQGADSAFVSILQGAYHPDNVTVKPNGQVRWQNFDDGVHHTVTSD